MWLRFAVIAVDAPPRALHASTPLPLGTCQTQENSIVNDSQQLLPSAGPLTEAPHIRPRNYDAFHCTGADCPDTCCSGWKIPVDKETYQKYQQCEDPLIGPLVQALVTIRPAGASEHHYAELPLVGGSCVFLSEGWCSIQSKLGEAFLSNVCSAYPRAANVVNGVTERSLDLSCPESARLVLFDPMPIEFVEGTGGHHRLAVHGVINAFSSNHAKDLDHPAAKSQSADHTEDNVAAVRRLMIGILQNRAFGISQRLVLVGHVCDRLQRSGDSELEPIRPIVEGFENAIRLGLFNDHLKQISAKPATQLGVTLNLLAERMSSDFVAPRFHRLFSEFQQGLGWTPETKLEQIEQRYVQCHAEYYLPLMKQHEHMLENYLVSYAFRNLFPYGTMEAAQRLGRVEKSVYAQYSLMVVHFAILKSLLIGFSGFHRSAFSPEHVAHVVQVATKTLDHSMSFPTRVIEKLQSWALTNPARLSILTHN